jgi:hypothetical protein
MLDRDPRPAPMGSAAAPAQAAASYRDLNPASAQVTPTLPTGRDRRLAQAINWMKPGALFAMLCPGPHWMPKTKDESQ